MTREIRFNAFDMNRVGHQSPGLWAHPRALNRGMRDK
jgi:long-chain alkane monooxygenase